MGQVIQVEFGKKNVEQELCDCETLTDYLNHLRNQGLDEDDVLDTLDAINDMNKYFASDEEVQKLADGWLHQFL
jgi:predicted RNase H-like nuclease